MFRNNIVNFRTSLKTLTRVQRGFKTTCVASFKEGSKIPEGYVGVYENSPGNPFDIGKATSKGKYIVVGLPAAFSPACSSSHVPGFIEHLPELKAKGVKQVIVATVNDSFVTKAWAESLQTPEDIRIIADTQGDFARKGGYLFDSKNIFGNDRSIRYALIVEDGKVIKEFCEPDKTGLKVSSAANVLKYL
ncbi:hypothetical protein TPHA_0A00490 [Tetrapisispora phaffii CBS 4417]|uniref:Thioredoxin domain-containing protein n=1 Tax=Tetrapisispora phaffii (strain ATCC 24235 / CBS 4417 / NBRC 1672 / NRRL Y-8282 / UCD 70-5) TaxID=1071381 RepID=G8BMK6_TETPH|nr:hypothetical protein TPHA_0A00490 [Tetrapisispora phaffii CBS 4417]CCE61134.1 hypothetical protein TPHA_0A00490 [Tetrapisispora phaffii CBS 4417]